MFCRKCEANIPDDSQFCLKCGVAVIALSSISAAPSRPVLEALTVSGSSSHQDALVASSARIDRNGEVTNIDYAGTYSRMSNDELRRVAADRASLKGAARTALEQELRARVALKKKSTFGATDLGENSKADQQTELTIPREARRTGPSRWARLGIFLCVALTSAILAAVIFVKGRPAFVEGLTERLTKASLQLGLAAWAIGEAIAGRWLTLKRTWIAAITLFSVAFVLAAVFLGKPLATKLTELNEKQAQLDRQFAASATGKALLQPQSFATPRVSATSLAEFQQYADATEKLNKEKEELLLDRGDPSFRDRWVAYFAATRVAALATEDLYSFAAEPSRQVHVENGVVVIADPDGYNNRMDAVNDAMQKLRLATTALESEHPAQRP